MKCIARYIIYIGCMVSAVIVLVSPIVKYAETMELDALNVVLCAAVGFTLVFMGTEASERLKKRWGG